MVCSSFWVGENTANIRRLNFNAKMMPPDAQDGLMLSAWTLRHGGNVC
jgi:hypothetical protein